MDVFRRFLGGDKIVQGLVEGLSVIILSGYGY